MVALHIIDALLSASAFQTDLLQKYQTEGPAVTTHVMVLVIHGCSPLYHHQVHTALGVPSPLALASGSFP